jgi:hypothetical protein
MDHAEEKKNPDKPANSCKRKLTVRIILGYGQEQLNGRRTVELGDRVLDLRIPQISGNFFRT